MTIAISPDLPPGSSVDVEVEWFDDVGVSLAVESFLDASPGFRYTFVTDTRVTPPFVVVDSDAGLRDFTGFARVHSNERNIFVTGQTCCHRGTRTTAPLSSAQSITAVR